MRSIAVAATAGLVATGIAYAALAQQANQQLDAAIARLRDALGPDARIEYRTVQAGPTGPVRLAEVRILRNNGVLTIGELELTDPRPDGVGGAVARNLRLSRLDRPGAVTAARVTLGGLTILPAGSPGGTTGGAPRGAPGGVPGGAPGGTLPGKPGLAPAAPAPAAPTPAPLPVTLGSGRVEGFLMDIPETRIAAEQADIADFRPGAVTRVALRAFALGTPQDRTTREIRVARAEAEATDLAATVAALIAGSATRVPDGRQSVVLEGVEVDGVGGPLGRAASARASLDGREGGPRAASLSLQGVQAEGQGDLAGPLRSLGYERVVGNLSLEVSHDGTPGGGAGLRLGLGGDGIGQLALSLALVGVPGHGGPEALNQLLGARLVSARLGYQDASLVPRVLRQQAQEQGIPEAQLREGVVQMIEGELATPGPTPPALAALRDALVRFVRAPGAIEIVASPPQPLPVASLGQITGAGPARAVEALRLVATTRPPGAGPVPPPAPIPDAAVPLPQSPARPAPGLPNPGLSTPGLPNPGLPGPGGKPGMAAPPAPQGPQAVAPQPVMPPGAVPAMPGGKPTATAPMAPPAAPPASPSAAAPPAGLPGKPGARVAPPPAPVPQAAAPNPAGGGKPPPLGASPGTAPAAPLPGGKPAPLPAR
ncbi:hypothetical protein M0638_03840 [Roseomonas sp. NAR14]|uniref:Uncharacterized protein n=1 Tax=Roseomonas acroporae TaxID=2937791 RepID=A0A9X1Y4X7_9PROT|nr:hypothetical protein [Roseomonas acroporae]MCK8783513.1 hypothetical protein [Roseomonas acroporae]